MLDPVINQCNSIVEMSLDSIEDIKRYALIKEYKKGDLILKPKQVANHACWILKGLVRSFYLKDTEEVTTKFLRKGSVITSVYSFYSRKPGNEFIMALEDTVLACFSYEDMQLLYKKHPEFNVVGRVITEQYLFFAEIELYNLRKQKAEDRYRFFEKHFPDLLQKVPLKYIATYLGMNLETLSRIRGKKR
ncbi:MAG TPA: Crp/Fnr family transcriptional regulator [Segetibacter sp.]|jgi:CRP-like cAMP-binding protein